MFGNKFAFEYSGYGDEPGGPPWLQHRGRHAHHRGWHHGHRPFAQSKWGRGWTPPWLQAEWQGPQFFGCEEVADPLALVDLSGLEMKVAASLAVAI